MKFPTCYHHLHHPSQGSGPCMKSNIHNYCCAIELQSVYIRQGGWTFICRVCASKRRIYNLVINRLCLRPVCHLFIPVHQSVRYEKTCCNKVDFPPKNCFFFLLKAGEKNKKHPYLFLCPAVNVGHPVLSIPPRAAAAKGFEEEQVWEACVSHKSE